MLLENFLMYYSLKNKYSKYYLISYFSEDRLHSAFIYMNERNRQIGRALGRERISESYLHNVCYSKG